MKAVYIGDSPVFEKEGHFYGLSSINTEQFKKYTNFFSDFTAVLRSRPFCGELSEKQLIEEPVKVILAPTIASPFDRIKNIKTTRQIIKCVLREASFVIIKVPTFFGREAITICNKNKIPYFIEVGECIFDSLVAEKQIMKSIAAPFLYLWHLRSLKKAKYGIYVTKKYLQKKYPLSKGGLYSSCSNVFIENLDERVLQNRKKRIKLMDKNICITVIGAMTNKLKGLDILIKALGHIKNDYHFIVRVYGKVDLSIWKKYKLTSSNYEITFEGYISDKAKLFHALDETDIFLHPSRAEGLPRAVIEAMSRGCPVVANSIPGDLELINNDFCFKKNSSVSCADKIELMLESKEKMVIIKSVPEAPKSGSTELLISFGTTRKNVIK